MAHKIIKTPGVLIHVNVVILAFLYVEIFTLVANDDNASWIGGTKLLSNQMGYIFQNEHLENGYDSSKYIEIG